MRGSTSCRVSRPGAIFFALIFSLLCGLSLSVWDVAYARKSTGGTSIGIDLGTTYSCVGVYRNGKVEIIQNELGERTTPSQVGFVTKSDFVVGSGSDFMKVSNPKSVVYDAKRIIGRDYTDPDIHEDRKRWPFGIVDKNGKVHVNVEPSKGDGVITVTPEEISAKVLRKMKDVADAFLGEDVRDAVITVPAYFNDSQRRLTITAAEIAGLNVTRIINEPTAAAIAYGLNNKSGSEGRATRILVYDLGGGTFDVSILEIQDGMFDVKATGGSTHLGGQDFNKNLVDHVFGVWSAKQPVKVSRSAIDSRSMASLYSEAEKVKRALSTGYEATMYVPKFYGDANLEEKVSRVTFERVNSKLFDESIDVVRKVMDDKSYKTSDIDEIVLVGGSTRIPKVTKLITDMFKKSPRKDINPDEAVAYGAAVHAAVLSGKKDSGIDQVILVDVTSLSLGIEVQGGLVTPIIPRNSPKPIVKSQTFTTVSDNQSSVVIKVYEGERAMAKDNFELGKFELTGILPAPRGTPQIEVSFKINADGILEVTASDKATGNTTTKVVRNDSRSLTPEQIEALIKESEENAEKDKLSKESAVARNELESFLYSMKMLKATAEKKEVVDSGDLAELTKGIEELDKWFSENSETITKQQVEEKVESLSEISSKISKVLYADSAQQPPPPPSGDGAKGGDDLSGGDI